MEQEIPNLKQTPSFIASLFQKLHDRQHELNLSNETLMQMTRIPRTTFYRIWRENEVDIHMDFYYIEKLCAALEIELTFRPSGEPAKTTEVSETARAEVTANTAELLVERKQEIENQSGEIANLTAQLAAKQSELDSLRAEHLRLALSVAEMLKDAQDQSNEIVRELLRRIDELQTELLRTVRTEK